MAKVSEITLRNGLRVVSLPVPGARTVAAFLRVEVGSRHETERTNGAAHYLEHLLFKGTEKWPGATQFRAEVELFGGDFNAETDVPDTAYYIHAPAAERDRALEALGQMIVHPLLDRAAFESERSVIIEEIRGGKDDLEGRAYEDAAELLWDNDPVGRPVAGTIESVKRLRYADLTQIYDRFYTARNMQLYVAGAVGRGLERAVEQAFGDLARGKAVPKLKPARLGENDRLRVTNEESEQLYVCAAAPLPGAGAVNPWAVRVLSALVGGGMGSRLFSELRERNGLCYVAETEEIIYPDASTLYIHAGLDRTRLDDALELLSRELEQLAAGRFSGQEIERARRYRSVGSQISLVDPLHHARMASTAVALGGDPITGDEHVARYEDVTRQEIEELAALLTPAEIRYAVIGPVSRPQVRSALGR